MKRVLDISGYPAFIVFALAGASLTIVAYATFNLLHLSMANLTFLREHGWLAITSGGLLQFLGILVSGTVALGFFFLYKICETDLMSRYRRWQDR